MRYKVAANLRIFRLPLSQDQQDAAHHPRQAAGQVVAYEPIEELVIFVVLVERATEYPEVPAHVNRRPRGERFPGLIRRGRPYSP